MESSFTMKIFLIWKLAVLIDVTLAFNIRLRPTNDEGTQGFVEAYYGDEWGFVGNPALRFSDTTASVLCRILGISHFGYGAGWTPLDNYYAISWLIGGIECHGNETNAGQCKLLGNWSREEYSKKEDWAYRYGSRLYCVESRLVDGKTHNSGVVESTFDGEVYQMCYGDFDMNAANVVCRSLGYKDALSVEPTNSRHNNTGNRHLECIGNESRLSYCRQTIRKQKIKSCDNAAYVTCEAVRLTNLNEYKDEGIVEVFHNGSWGMVGNPGQKLDDVTVAYLCKRFGFGSYGFGVRSHYLGRHEGIAWIDGLTCLGNETNVMNCAHDPFSYVPPLMHTYHTGSWINCFPYKIDDIRLTNGFQSNEGRVDLSIKGRWGSICTHAMKYDQKRMLGRVVCRQLGYRDIAEVIDGDNRGHETDLFWMSHVVCNGSETNIKECYYDKGSSYDCYQSPYYLRIKCQTTLTKFDIRLRSTNVDGTQGFVEAYHDGQWGFVGNPEFRFNDATASVLCRILGISHFGYGAGWTPLDNYYAISWLNGGIECHGNETNAGQCKRLGNWSRDDYSEKTSWAYRYGSRLYCVESRLVDGKTHNSGVVESTFDGEVYQMCYDGFDMNAANVVCRSLGYTDAISVEPTNTGHNNTYDRRLVCHGHESSLSYCSQQEKQQSCNNAAYVTCEAVRLTNLNENKDEGIVEVFHNGSWGMVGNPGDKLDDVTVAYLCNRFGFGYYGFGVRSHYLGRHEGIAWIDGLTCLGNETNVMNCAHDPFSLVPSLMHTRQKGSWIFCFPFKIDGIRLTNGFRSNEGRVELSVKGRWGSICTHNLKYAQKHMIGKVVCRQLGYREIVPFITKDTRCYSYCRAITMYKKYKGIAELVHGDNRGHERDLFWMSNVVCNGTESSIEECHYDKGSSYYCYQSPYYLRIKCKDDANNNENV